MAVLKPGDVLCLRVPEEVRGVDGKLFHPPELRVVAYNAERDELSLEPISFEALNDLAPEKHDAICAELRAARQVDPPRISTLNDYPKFDGAPE